VRMEAIIGLVVAFLFIVAVPVLAYFTVRIEHKEVTR